MKSKKAVFFSTDALIALAIVLMIVLVAYPIIKYSETNSRTEKDMLKVLSNLKNNEMNNSLVKQLISEGTITDLNKSILEQIGEFYITNQTLAEEFADSVLENIDTKENLGIWFGNTLMWSSGSLPIENAKEIKTARQIISGIRLGESIKGYSARAFLSSNAKTKYYYFGGYVGDGNISLLVDYQGNISNAEIEITINNHFNLYINDNFIGQYDSSISDTSPIKYEIPIDYFSPGQNKIEIKGQNLHIAGGYFKISLSDSIQYSETKRYYFPGIEGIINLYDGFYIPNTLENMNIFLHMDINQTTFLNIGNITIFNDSTNGEETISLDNSFLSSKLDYNQLSNKTIPLRLGLENASYLTFDIRNDADVFSVTDLSGSMAEQCEGESWYCCLGYLGGCNTPAKCSNCGGIWENRIQNAKAANKIFIDGILNYSGNSVGLVGYKTTASDYDFHQLSTDNTSLKAEVDSWIAEGNTCICCGINKAVANLISSEKMKTVVVMSDGEANVRCSAQGTGNAKQDAIQAACDAYEDYNITVYAIGFGEETDEATLQAIAACGNGDYYYGNVDELVDIYQEVAEDIIEASYNEQTLEIIGSFYSKLYPDSYIEFIYESPEIPYGLITTIEKKFLNSTTGYFEVPENSRILETKAISYSGSKWTDYVKINENLVYSLPEYNLEFIELGDPYAINIPNNLIEINNSVEITTGLTKLNSTTGSEQNKVIYTLLKNASSYSPIVASSEGCNWIIELEDNSNISIKAPPEYIGLNNCYFTEFLQQYNENDALQVAVMNLLKEIDINNNNKVDSRLNEEDLRIESNEITGIPFTWSTEVQIRRWL